LIVCKSFIKGRRLGIPVRDYLGSVLADLANLPINRIAELRSVAWAAKNKWQRFETVLPPLNLFVCLDENQTRPTAGENPSQAATQLRTYPAARARRD